MAYQLVEIGGVKLSVALDDGFRSSRLWLWLLKPCSYLAMRILSFLRGVATHMQWTRVTPAAGVPAAATAKQKMILETISQVDWYQSISLPEDLVTAGTYDLRPYLKHYPIPENLAGSRVLDAGTLDGFWAFEMEKRGAREVIALDVATIADLDLPPKIRESLPPEILNKRTGAGFEIARKVLNSQVERVTLNLYDLDAEKLGYFDFVFCADLLCLVSDPVAVLRNLRRVTRGQAVIMDRFNPFLPKYNMLYHGADEGCLWWSYSCSALEKMIHDAGFSRVDLAGTFRFAERGRRACYSAAVFRAWG